LAGTTTAAPSCSTAGSDRWGPNLGGCCNGLAPCVESRAISDSKYCAPDDSNYGSTCWSTTRICRSQCAQTTASPAHCLGIKEDCRSSQCCNDPSLTCYSKNQWWAECKATCTPGIDPTDPVEFQTPWSCIALPLTGPTTVAPQCSLAGADRWGPSLGGCCDGLQECVEARDTDDEYYCAPGESRHGVACWSSAVFCRSACMTTAAPTQTPSTPAPTELPSTAGRTVAESVLTAHNENGGSRLLHETLSLASVDTAEGTVMGTWSGILLGLVAGASAVLVCVLLSSFRKNQDLVQCDRIYPKVEGE